MNTLISPENHWAIWAALLCCGAFGLWAEGTRWGSKLSGAVLAIGAGAHVATVLRVGPVLFVFAALILTIHLVFLLGAAKILRIDLAEMVIASNANMGGPTTAAAMAVDRRWQPLVIPAILCGTSGYAVATFVGVAVGHWLR